MYEHKLLEVQAGKRTTVVARVIIHDNQNTGGHLCQSMIYGQHFRLQGELEEGTVTVSIINAKVDHFRHPILSVDSSATVLCHRQKTTADLTNLVETCVGLGGLGHGAEYAGWKVVCRNDIQPKFCSWLRQQQGPPVVEGSILHMNTIIDIHKCAPNAGSMAWGFACQPFSALGDQRHEQDERSKTLPFGLYAAWLLQVEFVVLECVPQGGSSSFVQACLDHHCSMTKGARSETLLELGNVWVSRRRRWWTILTKGAFGKVQLTPLPHVQPAPAFHQVLSGFMQLPKEAMDQLQLTPNEYQAFQTYGKGLNSQLVDPQEQVGTALHSWGNQVEPCACGCRGPLSHHRLTKGGLYGALCFSQDHTDASVLRHLGPQELAILIGMPMTVQPQDNQRLLLAGLGQIASPIQAVWVFAHLREFLEDRRYIAPGKHSPKQALAALISDLWTVRTAVNQETSVVQQLFSEQLEQVLQHPIVPKESPQDRTKPPDQHPNAPALVEANDAPAARAEESANTEEAEAAKPIPSAFMPHTGGLVGFSTNTSQMEPVDAASPLVSTTCDPTCQRT